MFKSYFKIAWRNLNRNRAYAFLNIAGLVLGFAACLLIGLYLRHEMSYDEFHKKADRIYRLNIKYGSLGASGMVPATAAPAIAKRFPEVVNYVRMYPADKVIVSGREPVKEKEFYYADASFFDIFSFSLVKGSTETALSEPNTVVLTKQTAARYFPGGNAMGQTLILKDGTVLKIAGILENIPTNSHLQFDFIASFETLSAPSGMGLQSHTYFLLTGAGAAENLMAKIAGSYSADTKEGMNALYKWLGFAVRGMELGLQSITSIHLQPFFDGMIRPVNNMQRLYIFGCIAFLVLLLACVNYVNLTTARASQRATEVGARKTAGAGRRQLTLQFLGEALITTTTAGLLSLVIAKLLLPFFNPLMGLHLSFAYFNNLGLLSLTFGILIIVGLLAGTYPALVLSRFSPSEVLKNTSPAIIGSASLRKGLVVFQFAISIVIIVATLVAHRQLQFIDSKPLGYQSEAIVSLPLPNGGEQHAKVLKNEIKQLSGIKSASLASGTPLKHIENQMEYKGETINITVIPADGDYLKTMDMTLIAGKGFPEDAARDSTVQIVVNETAARIFNLQENVGKPLTKIDFKGGNERLVGIVKDFHAASLYETIGPVVIYAYPYFQNTLVLRLERSNMASTLSAVEDIWKQITADAPFVYHFLDEVLAQLYRNEQRLAGLTTVFAVLAILIACLGLFGLATFAAERRTKEIGVRKVMGATVTNIVGLLSKDFLKLVLIGFVIAVPLAWYFTHQWLQDFAYRIDIGFGIFLLAGGLALLIALTTVSWQSIRAALANPVDSLRSE